MGDQQYLFRHTLRRPLPVFDLIRLPRQRKLPTVLSRQEVRQFLSRIRRPEVRMVAVVMYSCGMRVTAATRLRPAHIDSRRMMVCIRNAKGSKDRYVPLPQRTLELLRAYWREHQPDPWLFPDRSGKKPVNRCTVLKCVQAAAKEAKLTKPISSHTLRQPAAWRSGRITG